MTNAGAATVPRISEQSALEKSISRDARIRAVKDAISALEPGDLTLADAAKMGESIKVSTSEAEEQAIAALVKICNRCGKSPHELVFDFRCGSDYNAAICILKPFKPEKREHIIEVTQVCYRDFMLKS